MASEFIMADDDTAAPGASYFEDLLELSLLTAGEQAGPADLSRAEHPEDQ